MSSFKVKLPVDSIAREMNRSTARLVLLTVSALILWAAQIAFYLLIIAACWKVVFNL